MTLIDKLEERLTMEEEKSAYLKMVIDSSLHALKVAIEIQPDLAGKLPNMALIGSFIVISHQVDILKTPIPQIIEMIMDILKRGPRAAMDDLDRMGIKKEKG